MLMAYYASFKSTIYKSRSSRGGGADDGIPLSSFWYVAVFLKDFLWVVALFEACDVTKHGRHFGRRLGFCQEFEIR